MKDQDSIFEKPSSIEIEENLALLQEIGFKNSEVTNVTDDAVAQCYEERVQQLMKGHFDQEYPRKGQV